MYFQAIVHSASYWRERCIAESSTEKEEPPNLQRADTVDEQDGYSSTGTGPLKDDSTQRGQRKPKTEKAPPYAHPPRSPTTSSPVLLETPSLPLPCLRLRALLHDHRPSRQERRTAAHLYNNRHGRHREPVSPFVNRRELMRTSPVSSQKPRVGVTRPRDRFVPADWPYRVANLRTQFNPTGLMIPTVPHFGWCGCSMPCRVGSAATH